MTNVSSTAIRDREKTMDILESRLECRGYTSPLYLLFVLNHGPIANNSRMPNL